ncbi:MAG: hypothetical protein KUG52_00025 [Immundisolibacteraceae bacterium]|nr:hypothetical protein [Immundisolibacteraceae bacterium]
MSVGRDVSQRALRAITEQATVHRVFIGGRCIGRADNLEAVFDAQGVLIALLVRVSWFGKTNRYYWLKQGRQAVLGC